MKKIILFCVLTVASLLLALPFTPLRSSFKSTAGKYADEAIKGLGVDFKGQIRNARFIARAHQYEVTGLDISPVNNGNHSVSSGGSYSGMNRNGSGGISGNYKYENQHEGNSGGIGGGTGITSSGKSSSSSSEVQGGGFASMSSNITSANGSTTRQGTTKQSYSPGQGGTHPGLDPTGSQPLGTLPIGNGTNPLLAFAIILTCIKAKRIIAQ